MKYRPVVDDAGKFLPWIAELCGRSGAYVIRCTKQFCPVLENRILYVGESHTGNLSKTLKRHFFKWDDAPERRHNLYNRRNVEVAVTLAPGKAAVAAQDRLIHKLRPRDNAHPAAAAEEEPF